MRVLSIEEERRLFSALSDNRLVSQIVTVALHTGLRRGEIFNLKWFDIDLDREVLQVRESKSGKQRFVPINRTVRNLLEGIEKQSEYVFPSPKTGTRLDNIKKSFRSALRKAAIVDFCFHDLRHTAATRMADAGADAFTLMSILGHSDIRMTARYTHATNSAIKRAVANLDTNSDFSNVLVTESRRQAQGLP
jgi:integrase